MVLGSRIARAIGAVVVVGLLAACATPRPTPSVIVPVASCGPLTNVEWTNIGRGERELTDVEILTADLDDSGQATGEAGATREGPAPGYPVEIRPTATTAGDVALGSLIASLADRQVFIQTQNSLFRSSTAHIQVDHSARWITYADGTKIVADYSATCSIGARAVNGQLHGWTSPMSGELECSLAEQMPASALGQKVRHFCG
jgi:hypothetical protein